MNRAYRWIVGAVAAHSLLLGLLMLAVPLRMLALLGWSYPGSRFFPAQSGLFLLILGAVYLVALRRRSWAWVIVGSKAAAVLFLVGEAAAGNCPPIVFATAAGDGLMGLLVLVALRAGTEARAARAHEM